MYTHLYYAEIANKGVQKCNSYNLLAGAYFLVRHGIHLIGFTVIDVCL